MYVQKFEADTLDEALKRVKRELGPDAVILKTVTNKGLKGAFKKSRIEITAAISEKTYIKKAKVDAVLNEEQKQEFYQAPASQIKRAIERHEENDMKSKGVATGGGYGSLGLNRTVVQTKAEDEERKSSSKKPSLDDFLSKRPAKQEEASPIHQFVSETRAEPRTAGPNPAMQADIRQINLDNEESEKRIDELERKLFELTRNVERTHRPEPIGLYQLRTTLTSLDINEVYIQKLIRKAIFDLSEEDLQNPESVFEFALQEMSTVIKTAQPKFSQDENVAGPAITILLSETASGQTSMLLKLGALKKGAVLIQGHGNKDESKTFAEKIFGIEVVITNSNPEMIAECRKVQEKGLPVFIDYRPNRNDIDETKKMIEAIRRAFSNVEVLITLSSIHSELYNRNMLARYHKMSDGMLISHLDVCVSFGPLFNLSEAYPQIPYKFFGTGEVVPDDIESSSAERILAGMFELK